MAVTVEIDEKTYEEEVEPLFNDSGRKYFKSTYYHELFMAGMDEKNIIRKLYPLKQGSGGCELVRSVSSDEINEIAVDIYRDKLIPGYVVRIFNPLLNDVARAAYAVHPNLGSSEIRRSTYILTLGDSLNKCSLYGSGDNPRMVQVKLVKHQEGIWTQKK